MFIMHLKYIVVCVISALFSSTLFIECQVVSVLPTQAEQVNLLTNVHELFEEVKHAAKEEQMAMDNSMIIDLELMMKRARLTIDILQELTLLKLTTRSNAVCALDTKDEIEGTVSQALQKLKKCANAGNEMDGIDSMVKNSISLNNITESAVNHGEGFLDKLNQCSEKRGLAVIACYKKIIQNDVLPVKVILSEAIKNHRKRYLEAFELKVVVNTCTDTAIDNLMETLERVLHEGLNCR